MQKWNVEILIAFSIVRANEIKMTREYIMKQKKMSSFDRNKKRLDNSKLTTKDSNQKKWNEKHNETRQTNGI